MRTQVTFDCADPHALAAFWAEVLGGEVEDHSTFVNQLIADGRMPDADRIFVNGRSAFREVAACRAEGEPRFYFQQVPEGKIAKNRMHVDIHVDEDRKTDEVDRLLGLGAEFMGSTSDRGPVTFTMRDPEGNEFCLH